MIKASQTREAFFNFGRMIFTDTHTHLYYENDPEKRDELMKRSLDKGVSRLFLPNVDMASVSLIREMVEAYPENCFPMLGLHPCDVKENFQQELDQLEKEIENSKVYAVGEIGIDLYWDKSTLDFQKQAFRQQITWAKQLQLPIVIHCRDAFNEVYELLLEEKDDRLRGIFHCFTGTLEQARQIRELDFYLGIGGVVTYKNSGLDKVVEQLDLKDIVLETDSPYLTPVPFRGKPNESSYLIYVAQKVAELLKKDIAEVAALTTGNSKKIFGV